jgi:hypothetical protein
MIQGKKYLSIPGFAESPDFLWTGFSQAKSVTSGSPGLIGKIAGTWRSAR